MTNSSESRNREIHREEIERYGENPEKNLRRLRNLRISFLFTAFIIFTLYLLTLASAPVFGDPSEYTVVANQLGFAHPPGYAFITLLGKLAQTLIPFGAVSQRMHFLAALSALAASLFAFGTIGTIGKHNSQFTIHNSLFIIIPAIFTALLIATSADIWQHAIHANPHILTAAFLMANLFFLTKFWAENSKPVLSNGEGLAEGQGGKTANLQTSKLAHPKWLFAFALTLGLGLTHHPLTVMAWPAYGLFILIVRPSIWKEWRTLLGMVLCGLLGLTVWLYFPLRSATTPFGPTDLNTLDGFLNYILARGLSESLPFYGLADVGERTAVFWTLLRLQYSLPVIFLGVVGFGWLIFGGRLALSHVEGVAKLQGGRVKFRESLKPLAILYGLALVGNYAFVMNLRVQDIMAYLLGIFMLLGLMAGIGLYGLLVSLHLLFQRKNIENAQRLVWLLAAALFLLGPVLQMARNGPRISLRDYTAAQDYVDAMFTRFAGSGEGAVLLNDWEHMTPIWYNQYVNGRFPLPADVTPKLVSTGAANPWLENVIANLPGGPVYLSNYRREIVDFGFRLRPVGPFYQVIDIGSDLQFTLPPALTPVEATGEEISVVGYGLPETAVSAGDYIPLTLAFTTPVTPTHYYVPELHVGDLNYTFTTDSHQLTPTYTPNEIVVEAFDFALPHDLPSGDYPVTLNLKNLSTDTTVPLNLDLGTLTVTGLDHPIRTDHLLANFRQRVGLVAAKANGSQAPWDVEHAPQVQPGDTLKITLTWESLAPAEESYTIFIHLIDAANQPVAGLDYTPLGGSMPTHLWIPKWLPGQTMLDPYRLPVPENLAPGTYYLEVGLYEMVGGRRLHISEAAGNLAGDRFILGAVVVE